MIFLISRICILAGCLFASIYGVVALVRHRLPEYFTIALIGVFTLFLARLFYFVLTMVGGDDTVFTVGVLGQVAAYLLFMTANRCFVPCAADESAAPIAPAAPGALASPVELVASGAASSSEGTAQGASGASCESAQAATPAARPPARPHAPARRLHVPAVIAAGIPCVGFCAVGILSGSVAVFACELLYALCLGSAVYFAMRLVCQRGDDPCAASLVPFNIIVCALAYLNVFNEAAIYLGPGNFVPLLAGLSVLSCLLIVIMIPLLKRGVSTWPQPQ